MLGVLTGTLIVTGTAGRTLHIFGQTLHNKQYIMMLAGVMTALLGAMLFLLRHQDKKAQ